MTYFSDYSPYAYGHKSQPGVVHVGWLDNVHPYPKGSVDARLIEKMKLLASNPVELYRANISVNCALNRRTLSKQRCPTGSSSIRTVRGRYGSANAQVMARFGCPTKGLYLLRLC